MTIDFTSEKVLEIAKNTASLLRAGPIVVSSSLSKDEMDKMYRAMMNIGYGFFFSVANANRVERERAASEIEMLIERRTKSKQALLVPEVVKTMPADWPLADYIRSFNPEALTNSLLLSGTFVRWQDIEEKENELQELGFPMPLATDEISGAEQEQERLAFILEAMAASKKFLVEKEMKSSEAPSEPRAEKVTVVVGEIPQPTAAVDPVAMALDLLKAEVAEQDTGDLWKGRLPHFVKHFSLVRLTDLVDGCGRFDFNREFVLIDTEEFVMDLGIAIPDGGTKVLCHADASARIKVVVDIITACKHFVAEREAEQEAREQQERELAKARAAQEEQEQKEALQAFSRCLVGLLREDTVDVSTVPVEFQRLVEEEMKSVGFDLAAIATMPRPQREILAASLELQFLKETGGEDKKTEEIKTMEAGMIVLLKEMPVLLNLVRNSEHPDELWDYIGRAIFQLMSGIEVPAGEKLPIFEIMEFFKKPVANDLAGVLATLIEYWNLVAANERLKQARRESKRLEFAEYKEDLELLRKAGFTKAEAMQILLARIGKPSQPILGQLSNTASSIKSAKRK